MASRVPRRGRTPPGRTSGGSAWLAIVDRSAALPGDDDAAIIRRQSYEGIPSYSLLVCVASVGDGGVDVRDAPLTTPGEWDPAVFD